MGELVRLNIQGQQNEIQVREYQGQRVVTLKDIDELHQRPEGTARRNYNENKDRLLLGVDCFVRNSHEAKEEFGIIAPNGLVLITESGYLMLVKSFTDDLAWAVQRELVNGYFRARRAEAPTTGDMLVAMAQAYREQERRLSVVEAKVEAIETRTREAEDAAQLLPAPEAEVPELSQRAQLNRLIRSYCTENAVPHQAVWSRLYMEFRDRHHVDLPARAAGRKKGPLDVAEAEGVMPELYALAHALFGRRQTA